MKDLEALKALNAHVIRLSRGNPGAITVLMAIVFNLQPDDAALWLRQLERCGYYGSKIWIGYKDACESNEALFAISFGKKRVVDIVNQEIAAGGAEDEVSVKGE